MNFTQEAWQSMLGRIPTQPAYPEQTTIVTCWRHGSGPARLDLSGERPAEILRQMYRSATVLEDPCGCAVALAQVPSPAVTGVLRQKLTAMADRYDARKAAQQRCIDDLLTKYWKPSP